MGGEGCSAEGCAAGDGDRGGAHRFFVFGFIFGFVEEGFGRGDSSEAGGDTEGETEAFVDAGG